MKIYAIRDKTLGKQDLGYFFVNVTTGDCCIELCEDVDEWDLPFILDYYCRNGEFSIGMKHTLEFVRQRVIPSDRQNIGSILKDNGLDEYDEIKLFILSDGRCAQDECYIRAIKEDALPDYIKIRMQHFIEDVYVDDIGDYIVSYYNGDVGIIDRNNRQLVNNRMYTRMKAYISRLGINARGIGNYISIGDIDCISCGQAYKLSQILPLSISDIQKIALSSIMSTQDVMETYGCSRQNVNDLVKRGKLTPLESNNRNMIFAKSEVLGRKK